MEKWFIKELKPGIFMIQFLQRSDREAFLAWCPWTVKGIQLVVKTWPKNLNFDEVDFTYTLFWVRLSEIPSAYAHTQSIKKYAGFFGKVREGSLDRGSFLM